MTELTTPSPALQEAFAPTGTLRASINLGNPILAGKHPQTGAAQGVSVDLATELARRLALPLALKVFDTASKSVDAVTSSEADVGFFAIDPLRGQGIAFTAPYVLIEGSYLVRQTSKLQSNEEVDRAGTRVAVGKGSAYDLFLTRELQHAEIVRAANSAAVMDMFLEQGLEVAAGIRQQLEADAERISGLRLLPGRFMVIQQAMGLPKAKGPEAAQFLSRFIEDMKASGFVQAAMQRHGIAGASVAPLV